MAGGIKDILAFRKQQCCNVQCQNNYFPPCPDSEESLYLTQIFMYCSKKWIDT